ncbi:MAG: hypothetical protein II776_06845, partial [Clostridia bacterium]|nr:hypothetical protein [Clostridia bacterium]
DVAYSTVVTAALRERLLAAPFPRRRYRLSEAEQKKEMERVYGPSAAGCMALQEKVGNYKADRTGIYLAKEKEIREILGEMPSADEIRKILAAAGYDMKAFYDLYGEEKIADAVKWAKDLKDRYTVLWVNFDLYEGETV